VLRQRGKVRKIETQKGQPDKLRFPAGERRDRVDQREEIGITRTIELYGLSI
jgi:hypothetical protein